jgi:3-oxoacyl-[acyl-carrier protein] reductase
MKVEEKVAVVTGAAMGIGYAIAESLGRAGHEVVLLDIQRAALDEAVVRLKAAGIRARGIEIDLSKDEQIGQLPEQLGDALERVAILVNNAGISPKRNGKRVETVDVSLHEWELVLKVNITAPFRLSQLVLPGMVKNQWGRIVNISSKGGRSPGGVAAIHYVTTKSGMLGFTRSLAKDFAAHGITVNALAPGRIETPMTSGSAPEVQAKMTASIPVGRMGKPEEVGALVAFLASDAAGYITGATIDINGGAVMI